VAGLHLPPARAQLVGVGVCCAAVAGCITGSNLVPGFLLPATTLLLAPACLLATRVLPEHGARAAVAAVSACLVAGSVVVAHQAYGEPKRGAPVAVSTVPVRLGPAVVRVDAGTAAQLDGIASAARSAGWRDGDRLLDASFTPAVPLALRAAVPPVLFPAFPGWLPSSVCSAVSGLDRGWRDAWVLVDTRLGEDALAEVTGAVGRRWPQDYVTVATLENRWGRSRPVLARPRPGAGAEKPAPAGCLAR
jgi:hypothetical protein